ncbi:DUF1826 domain-containing protein [Rhizorhabdus phycosphaerae]|uniref:DUF1826 domain-containing protein n=1 Tax=Rhizorhabdus phycosphaerae TaxID=2711156 RepID=UPI0013EB7B78|nr:DUF1826 domain-containing protein [Rhizorhabdus phycosphaerae]
MQPPFSVIAAPVDPMVAIGEAPSVLRAIQDRNVQLALWQRPRPAALAGIDSLDWTAISNIDCDIEVADIENGIAQAIGDAGYDPVRAALIAEATNLALLFAPIMQASVLRFRLEVIATDACRKFHMDYVPARLLTTFCGRGTEWQHADRPYQVHAMAPGDVAIFKGRLLADEPRILHRSPPIGGTGESRLLLAIDPVTPDRHRIA